MVWHIFKKDLKLLWIFVVAVALAHCAAVIVMHRLGLFGENPMLEMLEDTVPMLAYFGSMFLIAAIVHSDVLPGDRQDWLVRPIPRKALLGAKLLFVLITVGSPILLANLFQALSNGFSFSVSLLPALSKTIYILVVVALPLFTLASVTRSLTEAFIFGCGCAVITTTFQAFVGYLAEQTHGSLTPVTWSGIGWVGELVRIGLVIVAAGVILRLQYFRRRTIHSRVLLVVFGLMLLVSQFLPWNPAFAIQRRLSSNPLTGADTFVSFDRAASRFRLPWGLSAASERENGSRGNKDSDNEVFLPLRVSGIPVDSVLLTDMVEVRLINAGGETAYHGTGETLEVLREGPTSLDTPSYQSLKLPGAFFQSVKGQSMRLELEYSFTLFGLSKSFSIAALGGNERMPGWGWCQTKMNDPWTAVELRCMQPGKGPSCGTVFLQSELTGQRNPEKSVCRPDYSPYSGRFGPDDMVRFGVDLPFRDPAGLAQFPIDGPKLSQASIVIRSYEPRDHFIRSLVIPEVRLADREAQ